MPISIKVAWRFLTHSPMQSILIIFGLAIGVAVQMFVGLLISSVQDNIILSTLGTVPHVTIESESDDELVNKPLEIVETISSSVEGITKSEIVAEGRAFAIGESENFPVNFRGLEYTSDDMFGVKENIIEGKYFESEREILIGIELQQELNVTLGETVTIQTGSQTKPYTVVGVFEQGVTAIDKGLIVGSIDSVRQSFDYRQKATSVNFQVEELLNVDQYENEIARILSNPTLVYSDWQKENALLRNALQSQDTSNLIIQAAILASVIVAITSVLSITVLQKARQIGILKAIGLTDRATSYIFLSNGFTLGALGASLGLGIGLAMYFGFVLNNKNPDGSLIFSPDVDWVFVTISWIIAVSVSTLAAIIPARRSADLSPIEVIQNG